MKHRIVLLFLLLMLAANAALAVEFTDALGRTVSIESPQRVVSLYNSYGDAWLLSGGALVGSIQDNSGEIAPGAENLGSHLSPNMELLFSLDPDFVLLAESVSSHAEIGAVLEEAGIPHAYFNTPDWRSYMDNIALFTAITGRPDLYEAQRTGVQEPIEALIAETAAAHDDRPTALLLRADSNRVKVRGSDSTVAGHILRDMGFVNLADGDSLLSENLSMEAVLAADPDYIFAYTAGSNTEAAMASLEYMFTGNPAWNTLTAVREGRFFLLDRELFHYHPNERWAESYAFIGEILEGEAP